MPIYIMASRPLIFTQNLYAADAIHAITAIQMKVDAFITYDTDFTEPKKYSNFKSLTRKFSKFYFSN